MLDFAQAQKLSAQTGGMDAVQTVELLELLMSGSLEDAQGAELLVNMAERGETAVEVAAWVSALREKAVACPFPQNCLDVCGTGGSGLSRFNVSTTVAFICAAHGIPVAKHGNRGSQRANGSFDLLDVLGIPFDFNGEQLKSVLEQTNLCFLFARSMHPAVGKVVPYRKAAGRRSIFNLAGPLANPADISHQIIG
ncbi:MAG: anthranilate phosphoribosyltransferase, partial [Planctomycetes bacterium]|nr:anthranilate phosphoribosyltransferase [Planctomycetota bacterium]